MLLYSRYVQARESAQRAYVQHIESAEDGNNHVVMHEVIEHNDDAITAWFERGTPFPPTRELMHEDNL